MFYALVDHTIQH